MPVPRRPHVAPLQRGNQGGRYSPPPHRHTALEVQQQRFFNTSFESPNTVEYHLECGGNDNTFWSCRWENTGPGARVLWKAQSVGNLIAYGYDAARIVQTVEAGAYNSIWTRDRTNMAGSSPSGDALLSLTSTVGVRGPALRIMDVQAGSNPLTQAVSWAWDFAAAVIKGKRHSDAEARLMLDNVNGRIYFGPGGSTAPTMWIENAPTGALGLQGQKVTTEAPPAARPALSRPPRPAT